MSAMENDEVFQFGITERSETRLVISFKRLLVVNSRHFFFLLLGIFILICAVCFSIAVINFSFGLDVADPLLFVLVFVPSLWAFAPGSIYLVSYAVPETLSITIDTTTRRMEILFFIDVRRKQKIEYIPVEGVKEICTYKKTSRMGDICLLIVRLTNNRKIVIFHNWRDSMDHHIVVMNQYLRSAQDGNGGTNQRISA
jgi:hypothetical protein